MPRPSPTRPRRRLLPVADRCRAGRGPLAPKPTKDQQSRYL